MSEETGPAPVLPPGVRTYHPRRGRMTDQQRAETQKLLALHGIPPHGPLDLRDLFRGLPVVVEIGFGMGEATAALARADTSTAILAVDVHTPGVLRLLRVIESQGLAHVRVAHEDAVELLRTRVPERSLAGIRAFFPDPWPKARHHKRRLVQPSVVALMASRLVPGGYLHLATDWLPYADAMLDVVNEEPLLRNEFDGYAPRPPDRPLTRFERQGLDKEHPVRDLVLTRR